MTEEDQEDIALETTADSLEMTPDIIVDQMEATAVEYYRRDDLERAGDYLEKLVQMRPDEADYWCLLGVIHRRRDRRGSALRCLKTAAEIAPEDRNVLVNLGETLIEVGRVPAGVDLLRAVFEEGYDPEKPPKEQDELTIRAGAILELTQKSIRAYVDEKRAQEGG